MTEAGVLEMAVGDTPESPPDTGHIKMYPKSNGFHYVDDLKNEKGLGFTLFGDSSPQLSANLDVGVHDIPGFVTDAEMALKQNTLVSGSNIKTVNGSSMLGEGDIQIGAQTTGALSVSGSDDVTLTSSSQRVQYIEMGTADHFVILPDATTLIEGYGIFMIINGGANSFKLKDYNGNIISEDIATGKIWNLILLDNSESGGEWKFVEWSIVDELVTQITGTISDPSVVLEISLTYNSIALLSETKVVVTFRNASSSNYGYACVLDVSGTTVTAGTPVLFESADTSHISVTSLSTTKAIVTYCDGNNSQKGTACVLDISGTTITPGTPVVFESGNTLYTSVTTLSETKAIVTYQDASYGYYGTACVLDISGTTITPGTPVVFDNTNSSYITISFLSSTKVVVAYRDAGNSNYGTACVLDISGTTITPGTPVVFESAASYYMSMVSLSETKAIVTYRDNGNSGIGTACVLDISGTTITPGTPVVFNSNVTSNLTLTALNDSKAIVAYQNENDIYRGYFCILNVSANVITSDTPVLFSSNRAFYNSSALLETAKVLIFYRDASNSGYGTVNIIT